MTAKLCGPLCVECGSCGWRRLFNAGDEIAKHGLGAISRRLVCSRCGARTPVLFRAKDPAEAKRWFSER